MYEFAEQIGSTDNIDELSSLITGKRASHLAVNSSAECTKKATSGGAAKLIDMLWGPLGLTEPQRSDD